jgi:FkbM family methyltransferase
MFKRIVRALTPGPIRRWYQRRTLDRLLAGFERRIVQHQYGDVVLKVELADPLAAGWYDHDWASLPELALLRRGKLQPGALVFDIGAHQGVVAMMLARAVGPAGRVIAVEPSAHNAAMCARNAELNAISWLAVQQAAISDREGSISFNGSLNGQAAEMSDYGGVIQVQAATIDGLSERYGAPAVVFLDVEGFECRALAGASRTLERATDWFVEVHVGHGLEGAGGSVAEILAHFPETKYERFIHNDGSREATPLEKAEPSMTRTRFFLTALWKSA